MKKTLQTSFVLLLLLIIVSSAIAQKKQKARDEWTLTNEDYAKIITPLYKYFYYETEDFELTEVKLYLINVSQEFKRQFVRKIKSINRNAKIKFLSKTQVESLTQKERKYSEISVSKQTPNSLIVSVADYSPCYGSGVTYYFRKRTKWKFSYLNQFVSECGFGCEDDVCLPPRTSTSPSKFSESTDLIKIKKKIIVEDDDPPPPLKIKKPNE